MTNLFATGTGVGTGCIKNNNHTTLLPSPSEIISSNGYNNIQSISTSSEVTYFIDNGKVYSFGSGQLGNGNSKESKIKPDGLIYLKERDQNENIPRFQRIYSNSHKGNNFCFLQSEDGMLLSFGNSLDFRTGLGSEIESNLPRYVAGFDSAVLTVSLGICHGVAITERGSIYLWGRPFGFDGEAYPTPTKFDFKFKTSQDVEEGTEEIQQIVSGEEFSLFLTKSGNVYGLGVGESQCLLELDEKLLEPTLLSFIPEPIKQISVGSSHVLALSKSNRLYCWGKNSNGALGVNEISYSFNINGRVQQIDILNVESIYSNLFQNYLITTNGEVYSWGYNVHGNLGTNSNRNVIQPQLIPELSNIHQKISNISIGEYYTLFLTSDQSNNYYTGWIDINQYKKGDMDFRKYPNMPYWIFDNSIKDQKLWITGSIFATNNEISDDQMNFKSMSSMSEFGVNDIAVGARCGYAITSVGNVYCWGSGFAKGLGQGQSNEPCKQPTQIYDLPSGKSVKCFSSQSDVCFVTNEKGNLYSFGKSKNFLTGQGSDEDDVYYPRLMEGFKSACGIAKVAISSTHCLALDKEGNIYAWGSGKALGNRNRSSQEKQPRKIQDQAYLAIDIACGDNFSNFLSDSGKIYTFGEGLKGQLGLGDNKFTSLPTLVKLPDKIISISASSSYSSAISEGPDSNLYFWGNNTNGLLNFIDKPTVNANVQNLNTPTLAPKFTNQLLHHMVLTDINIFAITTRGTLYAMGEPHLGIGSGIKVYSPILVESTQTVSVLDVKASDWQCLIIVGPKTQDPNHQELPNPVLLPNATLLSPPNSPNGIVLYSNDEGNTNATSSSVVDDPEEIIRHEDYIKKQDASVIFWDHIDKEIDINTWCGKIQEIKEFLNRLDSYKYDPNTEASIQHAQKIIPAGERVIKGWVMYSINHKDYEAERMLIITTENIYRIKYDWKKLQVSNYKKFPLSSVYKVKIGKFSDWKPMISSSFRKAEYEKEFGVQIWFENPTSWKPPSFVNPFAKKLNYPYITLRPAINLSSAMAFDDQVTVCKEIGTAIQCAIHYKRNYNKPIEYLHKFSRESPSKWNELPPFPVRKVESVQRFGANGLLSFTHNKYIAKTQNGFNSDQTNSNNNNNNKK